ncbi:MAG: hypothetical protein SF051_12285 [Elusimicrobiota bacterium]|nr:hypothetical protein [Elusimicrobiota bacterium]
MRTLLALSCLLAGAATAAADPPRFEAAAIAETARVVRAKEAVADPDEPARLTAAWDAACGWYRERDPDCFLPGPGDTVLLFRGERGDHPTFAIAPILRWDVATSGLCGAECRADNLPEALERLYASLAAHDFALETSLRYLYDFGRRAWYGYRVGTTATFRLSSLPRPGGGGQGIRGFSPGALMVTTHVMEEYVKLVEADGTRRPLDPLVSFSASPRAALGFTGSPGHLLVLAVPRSRLLPRSAGCPAGLPAPGTFLDVRACPRTARQDQESEYDAPLFIAAELVHAAYRR